MWWRDFFKNKLISTFYVCFQTEDNFVNIFLKKADDKDDWSPFIESGKLEAEWKKYKYIATDLKMSKILNQDFEFEIDFRLLAFDPKMWRISTLCKFIMKSLVKNVT